MTLIDVSDAAVEAINANGLSHRGEGRHAPGHPGAGERATRRASGPVDLIINFVKCYHTEAAIRAAAPMIGKDTAVLQPAERLGQRAAHRRASSARTGCWSA